MKKRIILYALLNTLTLLAFGQQLERDVISQGGNTIANNAIELSVTIGEPVTKVHSSNSVVMSQGFEQHLGLFTLSAIQLIELSLNVYPNPTSDWLQVSSDRIIGQIAIVNNMGQEIRSVPTHSKSKVLNVQDLPAGVYYIKIHQSESHFISKFIKI